MSDIYVFSFDDENNDYSTMGLVGALEPTECTFEETANGDSIITMKHPLDAFGKYTALQRDNILVVPVPVRTTPEIQNGSCVTQVWKYKVKPLNQLTSKNQRTLYKKSSGSSRMKIMNAGDVVTVVVKPRESQNISRWKVKSKYGTGWINPDGFELVEEKTLADKAEAIEEIQSPWSVTDQLFRIQEVEKELTSITVTARHISYDLLYDATYWYFGTENATTLQNCIDKILSYSYSRPTDTDVSNAPFRGHTNVANTQVGFSFRGKNPIECFLDPDEGICAKFGVDLIRDNHDLYFLASPGINRGVRIQYGKNMTGITYKDNTDEVVTRIIPTGETKSGEELFLPGAVKDQCIDSSKINDYPVIHVYYMQCENCKVGDKDEGGGTITTEIARNRMRAQAKKLYETGIDEPKIEMSVEFVNLGDTEEYSQFKNLENCFLFDYVIVQSPNISVDVTAQIVKMEWDCILDRMNSVEIGTVGKTLANNGITSWQIPSGFSGSKIANGTVGSGSLKENIIAARHIQSDTINANHIQANAVTADKVAANAITASKIEASAITAEKIAADAVEADKIKAGAVETDKLAAKAVTAEKIAADAIEADAIKAGAITANKLAANSVTAEKIAANAVEAEKIKAGAVETDKIKAGAVTAEKIASKTITADLIAAKTITADSGIIDDAAIGGAQIADGSITAAKIVSLNADVINAGTLSAERLVLVGDDGVIYKINAASSGLSMTELAKDEYKNYINGTVIVAKSITAAQIAAQTITGNEILAGSITAKEIDVSDLFASEATIQALNAMDIRGNTYLQLYVTDKIDDISIGGRNLLFGTNQGTYRWGWSMQTGGKTISESLDGGIRGCKFVRDDVAQSGWNVVTFGMPSTAYALLEPSTEYTVSMDYKSSVAVSPNQIHFRIMKLDGTKPATDLGAGYDAASVPADTWMHIVAKITTVADIPEYDSHYLRITGIPADVNSVHIIKNLKLEKGNKATDWSPAPEDVEGDIDALETRMSAAELKITSDAIVSTVTSSESYKTLSSTASAAKSASETNASDISGLKTRITTAESEILQKADSITLSVLQTQVDGISVGGRNYVLDSAGPFSLQGTDGTTVTKLKYGPSAEAVSSLFGKEVTVSADYDNQVASGRCLFNFHTAWTGITVFTASNSGTGHIKRTLTLPSVETNTSSALIYLQGDFTGSVTLTNIKVELGNKATDWSPAPEDPAGALSVSSDYSKVDINTKRVRIVSKQMEVAVPSEDGEDDVLRVDADGVHAEVVEADTIVSDSVVHTQETITYTPSTSGELAAILDELSGKHLTNRVYVNCQNITSGSFEVSNLTGGGSLQFLNGTMNALKVFGCGSTAVYASGTAFSTAGTALTLDGSSMVYLSGCKINAGVGFDMGTNWPAIAFVSSCSGDCTKLAQLKAFSVLRFKGATKPTGTLDLADGCEVYNATSDPNFAAAASPSIPTTQTVTTTLSPTSTYTLRGTSNSDGNKLYQGRYSSAQGMRKGVMLFTLPSDLTAADNIDSAVLTIKRISGAGQGGGVPVQVRCFDQTGTLYASATAYGGQTVSVDVTSAVKAMKTNGYTGLMLYNPSTATASGKSYTTSYARFAGKGEAGAPTLKISYRK